MENPKNLIYFLVVLLMGIGSINVLSASFLDAQNMFDNSAYFFIRYIIYAVISFTAMYIVSKMNYKYFLDDNFLKYGYFIVLGLLIAVDVVGITNKGAQRWLHLGPLSIQPSELAKIMVIMLSAKILGDTLQKGYHVSLISGRGVKGVAANMILCALVYAQPDLGTAAIIAALMLCVYIIAGIPSVQIVSIMGIALAGATFLTVFTPYRMQRIKVWFDPWLDEMGAGYQMVLSLLTIGSGGLFGTDWGQGSGKYLYLPEAHTDFAFAVFCQENGFIGAVGLMILFILLGMALFKIAVSAKDKRGFLLAAGISLLIVGQAVCNMAMVCGIFPVIGVPLVFISYGGTSMLISTVSIGLALSVYNQEQKERRMEAAGEQIPQDRRSNLRVVSRR